MLMTSGHPRLRRNSDQVVREVAERVDVLPVRNVKRRSVLWQKLITIAHPVTQVTALHVVTDRSNAVYFWAVLSQSYYGNRRHNKVSYHTKALEKAKITYADKSITLTQRQYNPKVPSRTA